jgi:hypothetical protein
MNYTRCLVTVWIAFLLVCCKKQDSVENLLTKFESGWTVAGGYISEEGGIHDQKPIQIAEDITTEVNGFSIQFNNLTNDSRGTVMDYSSWERILLGSHPSTEERLKKMPMLGGSGTIYPFGGANCNKGFLVIDRELRKAWAEIWDFQTTKRVRADFEGRLPDEAASTGILVSLTILQWPKPTTKQPTTKQPTAEQGADGKTPEASQAPH